MNEQPAHPPDWQRQRITELEAALATEHACRHRLERLLQVHRHLSEIEPELDLSTLLQRLLDQAETLTSSVIGFFHLFAEDQQTITLQIWSDRTLNVSCRAPSCDRRHYNVSEAGIWVDCIHARRAVIHNDFSSLSHRKGQPEGHVEVQRELVVPIFRNQHIVAIIGVGNKEQDYNEKDIEQITILGNLAWDIVLRKREENRLKESASRFRRLINEIPLVSIQGYGPDGTVRFWNPASEKLYGYSQEDALGKSLLELIIPPEMRSEVEAAIAAMARTDEPIAPSELTLMRKDGSLVEVFSSHALIRSYGGETELFCVDVDLSERKKIEKNLAASLQEREVLLKEVHHRVKNNLAAVIGLLDMQAQLPLDAGTRQVLLELSGRIRSMALAHEHLYQAQSLACINIQHYLEALLSHLCSALPSPHIHFQINAQGMETSLDLAIPCGLIVNELVTNAVKYAFPDTPANPRAKQCRVEVSMTRQEGIYTLKISDNGIGLPPDFNAKQTQSLGMLLVRMLGEHQLGGRCNFDGHQGTTMTLTFAPGQRRPHEQSHTAHR
ncbi:MAG: GAF domain-containing protein [Desulfobulbus sp.]|nr:GAF domain-containing protein [Desulfobulbus sp.]